MSMEDAIKAYCRQHSVSQKDIAVALGVSQQFMSFVARGHQKITDERIVALPAGDLRDALVAARRAEYEAAIGRLVAA